MKLKERVLLILLVSVSFLLIVKYKLEKKQLASSVYEELVNDKTTFSLDGDHSHQKRGTKIDDQKALDNDKNYVGNEVSVNNAGKKAEVEKEKGANGIGNKVGEIEKKDVKTGKSDEVHEVDPWDMWWTMVSDRHVTKPGGDLQIEKILQALAKRKILTAKAFSRGTQLKASLTLDGPSLQKVVFKPMRYTRDHIITGKIYDGFDRHNAEIAAFHLDRLLGFYRAPPVVGRRVDLLNEIKPNAESRLLKTFFKNDNGDECFYGVCYYCKKAEAACARGNIMEGSVTIWLPIEWSLGKMRHPWQRTYNNKKARWELDKHYCQDVISTAPYSSGPRLLDIIDTSIFDFIIGNGDRHHYETFKKGGNEGMLLHLDNAKSFGNPHEDDQTILAPLIQCCRIRKSTHQRLKRISESDSSQQMLSGRLRKALLSDPISPILTEPHLQAVDRRLRTAVDVTKTCISAKGIDNVVIDDQL